MVLAARLPPGARPGLYQTCSQNHHHRLARYVFAKVADEVCPQRMYQTGMHAKRPQHTVPVDPRRQQPCDIESARRRQPAVVQMCRRPALFPQLRERGS